MTKRIAKRAMTYVLTMSIGVVFSLSTKSAYSSEAVELIASIGMTPLKNKIVATDFTLENLKGQKVKLSDYRDKIVLLNFMATWCHWCKKEMPHLQKLHERFRGRDFVIVVVFTDRQGASAVVPFIKKTKYTFAISSGLLDPTGEVGYLYGVTGTPTTFLVDRSGKIIGWGVGYRDWSSKPANDLIEKLLVSKNVRKKLEY